MFGSLAAVTDMDLIDLAVEPEWSEIVEIPPLVAASCRDTKPSAVNSRQDAAPTEWFSLKKSNPA